MSLKAACHNIATNYGFHRRIRGGLLRRWTYLTVYYFIFIVFRWGDRHLRCVTWLNRLGLSSFPVEVETPEGARLKMDLHTAFDPLFSIIGERDYERLEPFRLSPGMIVLDGGANIGVYTTHAAKRVGESGRVVAVEPHPGNFQRLAENIQRNGFSNVELVQAALGDREGRAELFIHDFDINHSLVRRSGRSVAVDLRTVDGVIERLCLGRVDLIKLDTEGNVPAVLRGARRTLGKHRPLIVFERDTGKESAGLAEILGEFKYDSREISCFTYAWPAERPLPKSS